MIELRIIYKNALPYGIRDKGGFLFFFPKPTKYNDQEERYRKECEELFILADFLLKSLQNADLAKTQVNLPPEFQNVIDDKFWEIIG